MKSIRWRCHRCGETNCGEVYGDLAEYGASLQKQGLGWTLWDRFRWLLLGRPDVTKPPAHELPALARYCRRCGAMNMIRSAAAVPSTSNSQPNA